MAGVLKQFVAVTKPGIVFGNLISVAGGFFLASRGHGEGGLLWTTLAGVALVIASGCVWNNYVDRTLDRQMARTQNRVLAQGLMSPRVAVSYASGLGLAGLVVLWGATNPLCIAIAVAGLAIYVGVYSLYLKRKSIYGTLVGSLAGAAPPLIGYCAVRGRFDLGAVILLAIFSLWQMPHSYSIALYRLNDYTAAALPVLPVLRGIPAAKRQIVGYILAFVVATLALTWGGYAGYGYFAVALAVGIAWLGLAASGYRAADTRRWAKKQFIFSIISLVILCIMMSLDFTPSPDPGRVTADPAQRIGR